jgi:hypothetical protein
MLDLHPPIPFYTQFEGHVFTDFFFIEADGGIFEQSNRLASHSCHIWSVSAILLMEFSISVLSVTDSLFRRGSKDAATNATKLQEVETSS